MEEKTKEVLPKQIQQEDGTIVPFDAVNRPAGSWILQEDGTLMHDHNDEAMRIRHGLDKKEGKKK